MAGPSKMLCGAPSCFKIDSGTPAHGPVRRCTENSRQSLSLPITPIRRAGIEPAYLGFTSKCSTSISLSYLRKTHGRTRTCTLDPVGNALPIKLHAFQNAGWDLNPQLCNELPRSILYRIELPAFYPSYNLGLGYSLIKYLLTTATAEVVYFVHLYWWLHYFLSVSSTLPTFTGGQPHYKGACQNCR